METITEHNKIKRVAREYEKKGYNVIIEPKGKDIPSFISDYQPDLIVFNEKETVVIEVKTRSDMATLEKLKSIADIINERKSWRFELVITTSSDPNIASKNQIPEALSIDDVEYKVKEIRELTALGHYNAAFILSWSYFESLARQLLLDDKRNLTNKSSLTLVKTLFSFGYISGQELKTIEQLFKIRNQVVHGYKAKDLNKVMVENFIDVISKVAKENQTM